MARQYLRKCSIVIASLQGSGLDFANFKVSFQITRGDYQTPNTADIRIYNLNDQTMAHINNEFKQVAISAAYQETNYGLLFTGDIKQSPGPLLVYI